MKVLRALLLAWSTLLWSASGFSIPSSRQLFTGGSRGGQASAFGLPPSSSRPSATKAPLANGRRDTGSALGSSADLDVVGLVAGQENYGLAVVCLGEAIWSFVQAPSFDHAKVLVPSTIAALVLGFVSGPMITSGDVSSVGLGLEIATVVSFLLGLSYVARLVAPYSPSPKEIAFLGLLLAVAGFFSFSQNLVVDGFVTLPSIPLPSLPSFSLPF